MWPIGALLASVTICPSTGATVPEMPKWSWVRLGATDLPMIWPLVSVGDEDLSRESWQRATASWLERTGRGLVAVRVAEGPALAAFQFEAEGPEESAPCCFIVRLWVVEPGLPGRSLRACLAMARDFARVHAFHGVFLERAAVGPHLDDRHVERCAGHCGYLSCREGWYAPPTGVHDVVTLPRRRAAHH